MVTAKLETKEGKVADRGYSFNRQKMKELRTAKRMTQEKLAQTSGISLGQISRIEKGRHIPHFATVEAIAGALECDPDDLLETSGQLSA